MSHSDDELRAELASWGVRIRAADEANPTRWSDIVSQVTEMERENPQFKDREYMLELATRFFTDTLRKRGGLRYSRKRYRAHINTMLLEYPQPMLLLVDLGFMLDIYDDPTDMLEDAVRLAELAMQSRQRFKA